MKIFYFFYFIGAVASIISIIKIQYFWEPDEKTRVFFSPSTKERIVEPERGNILARDGRPLAIALPNYHVTMDCAIHKNEYDRQRDKKIFLFRYPREGKKDSVVKLTGREIEREWRKKVRLMCNGLERLLGGKTAETLYQEIIHAREAGRRNYKIAEFIDYETKIALEALPLIEEGQYKSGVIITQENVRNYPYGSLARRTIGYIPKKGNIAGNKTGIEYSYDSLLRGTAGCETLIEADGKTSIVDHRSEYIRVKDGYDVRTTLDIDFQNICDRELRKTLESRDDIEGGCMLVMEVETGAIRAMVNLKRGQDGNFVENYNYAVLYKGATGSVFKPVTLMALLEDNKVELNDTVNTYGGVYKFPGWTCDDRMHTSTKLYPDKKISIKEGLAISSNIVFSTLVYDHYKDNPQRFRDLLHDFHIDENFDFDIEGLPDPIIPRPGESSWSGPTLPNISIGSSIDLCPLHTLCFYNAIAGKGRMMKPYLVEGLEKNGEVIKNIEPVVIDKRICRPEVADSLISGLCGVTERKNGTAYWAFINSPYRFAGKTGTGRLTFVNEQGRTVTIQDGKTKNIGTFVGFFPVENPKYTIMAVGYQYPHVRSLYGSLFSYPVRKVADALYAMDCENGKLLEKPKHGPAKWEKEMPVISAGDENIVPDLKNCGLADAIWKIENSGYQCTYTGSGQVYKQSPAAGTRYIKGQTIRISLR